MEMRSVLLSLPSLALLAGCGGGGGVVFTSGSTTIAIGDFDTDPIDQDTLKLADALEQDEPVFTRSQVTTDGRITSVVINADFDLAILVDGRNVATLSDTGVRPDGRGDRQALGILADPSSDFQAVVNYADNTPRADPVGGSLDFATYGIWLRGGELDLLNPADMNRTSELAAFYGGTVTPLSEMPQSGSATFEGGAIAASREDLSGVTTVLTGPVSFDVAFGRLELTGDIALNNTSGGRQIRLSTRTMRLSGNTFEGAIAGESLSGGLTGAFFGEHASELAGTFIASDDSTTVRGGFGARRD